MIKKIALGVAATALIAGQAVAADVRPAAVTLSVGAQNNLPAPAKTAVRKKNQAIAGLGLGVIIPVAIVAVIGLVIAVSSGGDGGSND